MLTDLLKHWKEIIALILGIYEVVIRIIPTVSNLSIIGKLITILKWLSDYFNIVKK
jgi:hypothetical protein